MGEISKRKINNLRKKQKALILFKFILLFLLIIPLIYLLANDRSSDLDNGESLGTQLNNRPANVANKDRTSICLDVNLPDDIIQKISNEYANVTTVESIHDLFDCDIQLMRSVSDSNLYNTIHTSPYVLVSRIDSKLNDDHTILEIREATRTGVLDGIPLIWGENDQGYIFSLNPNSILIKKGTRNAIVQQIKENPDLYAVIPISALSPDLKIHSINKSDPLKKEQYLYHNPLLDIYWINISAYQKHPNLVQELITQFKNVVEFDQFDNSKIEVVTLTGRSAVGARSHSESNTSPLSHIKEELMRSDLLFISNQAAFTDNCIQEPNSTYLCGKLKHFQWIKDLGVDIVSVAGENIIDQGREAFSQTLVTYQENGIKYAGGGFNTENALNSTNLNLTETNISFISSSLITPTRYLATRTLSGNVASDTNKGDAQNLKDLLSDAPENSFKIVEIRWNSTSGTNDQKDLDHNGLLAPINDTQKYYSQIAIDNGADIVFGTAEDAIGSIYHYKNSIIFQSLGNFLYTPSTESTINEVHGVLLDLIFYEGNFISYKIKALSIDDSNMLNFKYMDTNNKIMNTVYVGSFDRF